MGGIKAVCINESIERNGGFGELMQTCPRKGARGPYKGLKLSHDWEPTLRNRLRKNQHRTKATSCLLCHSSTQRAIVLHHHQGLELMQHNKRLRLNLRSTFLNAGKVRENARSHPYTSAGRLPIVLSTAEPYWRRLLSKENRHIRTPHTWNTANPTRLNTSRFAGKRLNPSVVSSWVVDCCPLRPRRPPSSDLHSATS